MEERNWEIIDEWMRHYAERIVRVVYLIIDDYYIAEEITQEVFVKAYRNLDSFRGDSSVYTWLYRIALNLSKNHLTRRARLKFFPLGLNEKQESMISEPLEEKVAKKIIGKKIRDCIQQLPLIYREVIILHYFDDLKITEISNVLQQPEGTIKSKLSRGRESLEKIMRKEGLEYGREGSI